MRVRIPRFWCRCRSVRGCWDRQSAAFTSIAYPREPFEITILAPEIDNGYDRAPHGGSVLDGQHRAFPLGGTPWPSRTRVWRLKSADTSARAPGRVGRTQRAGGPEAALVVAKEEGFMRRMRLCCTCRRNVELTGLERCSLKSGARPRAPESPPVSYRHHDR